MASIDSGGGHGGKKTVDQEIPLVPFIDLLLCCVMFLLVTAVWNQLARLEANQQVSGPPDPTAEPPEETEKFYVQVTASGFTLLSTGGTNPEQIPKNGEDYDTATLATKLEELKTGHPNRIDINVSPDDDVPYRHVIAAMDTARGSGWTKVTLTNAPGL